MPSHECIVLSTADWDAPYWTNKQHTARQLSKLGWRVLYVESVGLRAPKVTSGMDWKRLARRLWRGIRTLLAGPRETEKNLWVLSPLAIPFAHDSSLVRAFNQGLLRRSISRFLRKWRFSHPLIWTYHPFMLETIEGLPVRDIVYHCVDDLSAVPGIDAQAINKEEERLLSRCTNVFTTSEPLYEKCRRYNRNTYLLPNVVDIEHFGRALDGGPIPSDLERIPEPRLGYHGMLSDYKIDFGLIFEAARRESKWHWVFIGEEREGQTSTIIQKLRRLPNVHFLGYRPYNAIPDYLRGISVGLLPTLINEYTRSMFPMKYFEYLASGVPVASTPLDFIRTYNVGLESGGDVDEFAKAIRKQLERGRLTREEVSRFIGNNTWEARMSQMLRILGEPG